MNPFEIATNDIFSCPDFLDTAVLNGKSYAVIASEISVNEKVSLYGVDEGISFFLRVRVADLPTVRRDDEIFFKGVRYRVDSFALDSTGLVWRIHLKSTSSR